MKRDSFTCAVLLAGWALVSCGRPPVVGTALQGRALLGSDGAAHELSPSGDRTLAVLIFFADHCPCQTAHDGRIRDLYAAYHARGVDFFAVDSESDASRVRDAAEAAKRAYPFPILLDPGGALAKRVGAEYATETLVIDRRAIVRYRGGLDSDRKTLHEDASPFLKDALDDLLAGRPPRRAESEALGCALQIW